MVAFAEKLNQFATWLQTHQNIAAGIMIGFSALGVALVAAGAVALAVAGGPVALVVLGIGAVGAAIAGLAVAFPKFGNGLLAVGKIVWDAEMKWSPLALAISGVTALIAGVQGFFESVGNFAKHLFGIKTPDQAALPAAAKVPTQPVPGAAGIPGAAGVPGVKAPALPAAAKVPAQPAKPIPDQGMAARIGDWLHDTVVAPIRRRLAQMATIGTALKNVTGDALTAFGGWLQKKWNEVLTMVGNSTVVVLAKMALKSATSYADSINAGAKKWGDAIVNAVTGPLQKIATWISANWFKLLSQVAVGGPANAAIITGVLNAGEKWAKGVNAAHDKPQAKMPPPPTLRVVVNNTTKIDSKEIAPHVTTHVFKAMGGPGRGSSSYDASHTLPHVATGH